MSLHVFALSLPLAFAAPAASFQEEGLFRETHLMLAGTSPTTLLEDFDGDGDLDAWLGGYTKDCVRLNSGIGVFTTAKGSVASASAATRDLAAGDLDGDGDLDVFAVNEKGSIFAPEYDQVYLNDGAGAFTEAPGGAPFDSYSSTCVELADLDGDGDLDALVGNRMECFVVNGRWICYGGEDSLFLNDGSGAWEEGPALPVPADSTYDASIGDVDGDGDLDAWLLNNGHTLLRNDGAGGFVDASAQVPASIPGAIAMELGDVDGDGDLDAMFGGKADSLLWNDGAGGFAEATASLPVDDDQTQDLAMVDVDGDGDLDALLANEHQDLLYENDGGGGFSNAPGALPLLDELTYGVAVGDVDGDGDVDGIFSGKTVFLNDGSGTFADFSDMSFHTQGTASISPGDVDSDGDEDAFVISFNDIFLLENQGAGTFTDASDHLPPIERGGEDSVLGDVDGDGDLDLVFEDSCGLDLTLPGPLYLLLNEGGVFTNASASMPSDWLCTDAIALGDLDQDGDLDIFLGNTGLNTIYVNDGSGVFTAAAAKLPPDSYNARSIALGDVDGDGSLDALLGGVVTRLYLNDGTGAFVDAPGPAPTSPSAVVALGDVDGDLDLDAWVAGFAENFLYLNDGTGAFTDASAGLPPVEQIARDVALRDADGDGDLDAWIGSDGQDRLLRNEGAGVFTDATAWLPFEGGLTHAVVLEDLDGDGDLDALVGNRNSGGSTAIVYSNLSRHVAWRAPARLGKPFELDLHGTPSSAWTLAASPAAAAIDVSPFGTLLLDPMRVHVAGAGVLDAEGRAVATFQVPDEPALLGSVVHWQALLGLPLRFSNLEQSPITAF